MENAPQFERKCSDPNEEFSLFSWVVIELLSWLLGGALIFCSVRFIKPLLAGYTLHIFAALIGFVFLAGIVLPIVLGVISWRNDPSRSAGGGTCGR